MKEILFPAPAGLAELERRTPEYMRPNRQPWVVVLPGYLSSHECTQLRNELGQHPAHEYDGCGGKTREITRPLPDCLDKVEEAVREVNLRHWDYILDQYPAAWLQTYNVGDNYQVHMDGSPGQMRKLTGIVMLTESHAYSGGDLSFLALSQWFKVDRTQGTIVVIPHWLLHEVSEITQGTRQSINMGFWGPPFH